MWAWCIFLVYCGLKTSPTKVSWRPIRTTEAWLSYCLQDRARGALRAAWCRHQLPDWGWPSYPEGHRVVLQHPGGRDAKRCGRSHLNTGDQQRPTSPAHFFTVSNWAVWVYRVWRVEGFAVWLLLTVPLPLVVGCIVHEKEHCLKSWGVGGCHLSVWPRVLGLSNRFTVLTYFMMWYLWFGFINGNRSLCCD